MNPDEFTNLETFVEVSGGHKLYLQDWGNKAASQPIVFLHGGPGEGINDRHRQYFNPEIHRVIFFDQRGCGKSLPYGSLENNTTADLVNDIEKIISLLDLNIVRIFGVSWGSCLALAYAIKYPKRVGEMILRGVFTGSSEEIDYLDKGGYRIFFPDAWAQYLDQTPPEHRDNPTLYHFRQILSNNHESARKSAYIYANLEHSLVSLDDRFISCDQSQFDPAPIRIEAHYTSNQFFMEDHSILDSAHLLNIPVWLVQGRYDAICPPSTAYELHKKILKSTLLWTMAGHGNDRSSYDVVRTILAHWN